MSISNSLKEFTLSTLNTYLIPSYWTKFKTNPVGRALKISEFYNKHQPDIIMLQEVWGVGIVILLLYILFFFFFFFNLYLIYLYVYNNLPFCLNKKI